MILRVDEPATAVPSKSVFCTLAPAPVDEPFALNAEFLSDTHPLKVNLGIGVYRTDEGASWPLPAVEAAEQRRCRTKLGSRHDYLPIQGDVEFLRLARDVVFGAHDTPAVIDASRVTSVQTVSGTGANHLGAAFLVRYAGARRVWIPDPTWSNHHAIWDLVGAQRLEYPYFDPQTNGFNFTGMMRCLQQNAEPGDVVLLHACAHNPTGADPDKEQWAAIAELCAQKQLFPFFDLAYQGFASGDLDEDAWAVRHFADNGMEICVAQSFSKNFGLYGQRVGALHVVHGESVSRQPGMEIAILSNLCHLVRGEFSMAPRNGSDLVKEVLGDSELRERWVQDLKAMSERIRSVRRQLYDELCRLGTPGSWEHIINQVRAVPLLDVWGPANRSADRHVLVHRVVGKAGVSHTFAASRFHAEIRTDIHVWV